MKLRKNLSKHIVIIFVMYHVVLLVELELFFLMMDGIFKWELEAEYLVMVVLRSA